MSKVLMESLKMDLPALADMIRSKGRGRDTMLAHITPKEAALLKRRGGSGTINPDTGLPEFFEVGDYFGGDTGGTFTPAQTETGAPVTSFEPPSPAFTYTPATPAEIGQQMTTGYQAPDYTQVPGYGAALKPGAPQIPAATTAAFMQGEPGQLPLSSLAAAQPEPAVKPTEPGYFDKALKQFTDPSNLARLGLATGLGVFGASQARKGGRQIQAATGQQQQIATPYQSQGQQLVQQAQAGQLSPASQQAYQAAQAQMNQQIANRGGVGVQQAANQMAGLYQTLLNNQYTYGLNVMQIGDNIALGAIRTGLQLDQQLGQATTNFYTQLAAIAAGGQIGGQTKTVRVVE
jgi:hypothetical protein